MTGAASRVVQRTANHAIGLYEDLVITYAFRGTVDDPRHISVTAELVRAENERRGERVRVMFVLAEASISRPPSAEVRATAQRLIAQHEGRVSKVAVVVAGEGFGPAIHRAVFGGIMAVLRPSIRPLVVADARSALTHLLEPDEPLDLVLRFCEEELSYPG